ncbi:hypothetical protein FGG08_001191 [Glutinoglossum americanum]|uniref:DNA/RNA-binding protein Alba-like domain-containing protein n=1 Tax=Glutinoglossum americanum TaxID=1670608 RepID=A0A9P8IDZ1_9PEZI|nr:hypothetical protein FGG08_001191 [Glutinoglossum americanum]
MARTKRNGPGGTRRQKNIAPKAQRQKAQATINSRQDGERPAKKARLEKGIALPKPGGAPNDATQASGKHRDKKATFEEGLGLASAVLTRPKRKREPPRPVSPPRTPIEQPERSSLRTSFISSLSKTHDVIALSVISSSSIQKKVSRILSHLSPPPIGRKPPLVVLTAKAGVASKAITIAEISKREIGKDNGVWFQYSGVEGVLGEWTPRERGTRGGGEKRYGDPGDGEKAIILEDHNTGVAEAEQEDIGRRRDIEEHDEEEEAFEAMPGPPATNQIQERPSIVGEEPRKKVRAVPVLTIYLSRTQIVELKKEYG